MKIIIIILFIINCIACGNQTQKLNTCNGSISGHIIALEGFIDSATRICAIDTMSHKVFIFDKFTDGDNFQLSVPEGVYFVYEEHLCMDASHKEFYCKGYYTDYIRLGYYQKDGNASLSQ